ncbi:MAG TPA: hypothetical protein VLT82_13615 [Myxococcaceae bacterium]|nr:hypothetical protein [Myxococcaceae bacterium]
MEPELELPAGCRRSEIHGLARTAAGVVGSDLDGDGVPDALRVTVEDSGSGGGGTDVELRLSSLLGPIRISEDVSFSSFLTLVPVPPALLEPRRAAALQAVNEVLNMVVCERPDPSLAWLLAESRTLAWVPGPPRLPESYGIVSVDPSRVPTIQAAWFEGSFAVVDVRLRLAGRRGIVRVKLEDGALSQSFCEEQEWDARTSACRAR